MSTPQSQAPKETKQAAPSPETRAALHEVLAAFEAFKAANDARLDEIETRRSADVLLEEKVARIDAGLMAAQARLDRAGLEARRPSLSPEPRPHPAEAPERKAWTRYLKTGAADGLELKALSEDPASTGGYVAPPETEAFITRRLQLTSPMREIAQVQTISASVYRKPFSISGVGAGWAAETAARTETTEPVLALQVYPAMELYAAPAASQTLLDDALVNLDDWLAGECEDAFAGQETTAFITGDGVSKPKGLLANTPTLDANQQWGQIGYVLTGAEGGFAAAVPADTLMSLIYTPRVQFRPRGRFVMNRRTTSAMRQLKDGDGRYVWAPGSQPGQPPTLFGYPVTEMESMPDIAADSYSIAFGDFTKGYLIVDRAGIRVLRDPFTAKPYVLFYTTKRVGGGVQNFDAIKLLKFGTA
ncbi:MAG: phage major capsid protein [Pseudomonadota bacterium]|jgi:HK97 family phage major capsid protein